MAYKLIMTWDIGTDREQEYFEFVVREFIPNVQRLCMEMTDAWATVYGDRPQILVGAIFPSMQKARQILHSGEWKDLNNKLAEFVKNYSQKVVEARGGFQF